MSKQKRSTTARTTDPRKQRAAILARAAHAALTAYLRTITNDVRQALRVLDDVIRWTEGDGPMPNRLERWNWVSSFACDLPKGAIFEGEIAGREEEKLQAIAEYFDRYECFLPICEASVHNVLDYATGVRAAALDVHIRQIEEAMQKTHPECEDDAMTDAYRAIAAELGSNEDDPDGCVRSLPARPEVRS